MGFKVGNGLAHTDQTEKARTIAVVTTNMAAGMDAEMIRRQIRGTWSWMGNGGVGQAEARLGSQLGRPRGRWCHSWGGDGDPELREMLLMPI